MKIYVIRHGETDANKNGVLQGSSNWPLNDSGIKLAILTGQKMKDIKFDICYSSPLDRALQTASIILKESKNNTKIEIDERISEINMGNYEGKKFRPGENEVPIIKVLLFKLNAFFVGRFKGGESAADVCKRTQDFLLELSKKENEYQNVLVSTHGCAMRAMLNRLYKNRFNFWQGRVPYNCAVNLIEVKNGKIELIEKDKVYYDSKYIVDRFNLKNKGE